MPLIDPSAFRLAVGNIAAFGDTDVFAFPVENHVLYDQQAEVIDLLSTMSNDFPRQITTAPPFNHAALSPVGYNGFRWATQIDPIWNAYFLGLVLSLAPDIENQRISANENIVFSHRFQPEDDYTLFDRRGWMKFRQESETQAAAHQYVVSVDIADFYGRLYHHRIENLLKYVDHDGARTSQIMRLLSSFSHGVSYGLPVGGPGARILSELVLNSMDQLLLSQSPRFKFVRYADDYRFFVNDLETAHRAIGFLSEKLQRNEGLSLQRSKTRIMTSAEYLTSSLPQDPRPGSAAKFLSLHLYYDPYSPTAQEDFESLKEQLNEFDLLGLLRAELFKGHVDVGLTRRLVAALKYMPPMSKEQAVRSLLENLETLAPVLPHVMRAIRENVNELPDNTQNEVHSTIREMITSGHHLTKVEINLSYMLRVLSQRHFRENELLFIQLYDQSHGYAQKPAPNIQHDILLVLAKWGVTYWLHDLKPQYGTMNVWVRRAFLIGSYSLGEEGRHWRRAATASGSDFDKIVQGWMSSRAGQTGWEIPV